VLTAPVVAANAPLVIRPGTARDVDRAVRGQPGITLVDLENLAVRPGQAQLTSIAAARDAVTHEVGEYLAAERSADVTRTVAALRRHASEVVDAELLRLGARLPELSDDARAEIVHAVHLRRAQEV
jgi:glutamyl-tRNA reductase